MMVRLQHQDKEFIGPGKNQYQVLERISSGGMGTVYKVENVLTGQLYAVKECDILDDPRKKQISREEAVRIFLREGKLMEGLDFPGIPNGFLVTDDVPLMHICLACGNQVDRAEGTCQICDHGSDSIYYQPGTIDKRYYLFMEYIRGQDAVSPAASMTKPVNGRDLSVLLAWMREVAVILSFLHGHNLVHRDLKPENIRIRQNDQKVFLLDYGLMEHTEAVRNTLDLSSAAQLGTEGYAPPEQAGNPPEPANDVYSFAMTFLAMATDIDPTNPLQKNHLLHADPCMLVPGLPPRVGQLLTQSLDHSPARRPSIPQWISTLEAAADPATWQDPIPSSPRSDSTSHVIPKGLFPPVVRRVLVAAMVFLALFLIWPLFSDGEGDQSYEVRARNGAVLFSSPVEASGGLQLDGGEILEVRSAGDHGKDNWLRVVSVDGKSQKGYVKRNKVDTQR